MKTKQGISLIVLVITIIVMTILAGAIILTLNNSGIIDKASDAVEKTNLATVKELAQTAWASAYASGERTEQKLKEAVDNELATHKIDTTKYAVEVTTDGVNVVLKGSWIQTGETVTDGEVTIKVGEKINYIATGTDYSGDWKVLGASKYGELLIMSDSNVVSNYRLGYKSTAKDSEEKLKESQNAWLNGAAELDEVCEPYGKGTGATGARSITVEDVNRVTGYDPETEKYGGNGIHAYGNEVEFSYNGTTQPAYSGANGQTGTLESEHNNGFHFYNGKEFVHINDLLTGTEGKTFATIKSDVYIYLVGDLELSDESSLLIFGNSYYDEEVDQTMYSNKYWLTSSFIRTFTSYVSSGMRYVENGCVSVAGLWTSTGSSYCMGLGVRAVVSLDINVNVSLNEAGGWNINI